MSAPNEQDKFALDKIAHNNSVVYFWQQITLYTLIYETSRILISTFAGCAVGILGITSVYGFVCYFLAYGLITGLLLLKMNFKTEVYFPSLQFFLSDGLFQGLMVSVLNQVMSYLLSQQSYILFWMYPSSFSTTSIYFLNVLACFMISYIFIKQGCIKFNVIQCCHSTTRGIALFLVI